MSQAVLSLQLPFAIVPLIRFTSDERKMGELASSRWLTGAAWLSALLISGLNLLVLAQTLW